MMISQRNETSIEIIVCPGKVESGVEGLIASFRGESRSLGKLYCWTVIRIPCKEGRSANVFTGEGWLTKILNLLTGSVRYRSCFRQISTKMVESLHPRRSGTTNETGSKNLEEYGADVALAKFAKYGGCCCET